MLDPLVDVDADHAFKFISETRGIQHGVFESVDLGFEAFFILKHERKFKELYVAVKLHQTPGTQILRDQVQQIRFPVSRFCDPQHVRQNNGRVKRQFDFILGKIIPSVHDALYVIAFLQCHDFFIVFIHRRSPAFCFESRFSLPSGVMRLKLEMRNFTAEINITHYIIF
ncbi:MAG: hypothetical protein IJU41_03905 [Clostridia bacterium]|nr:hypothetical protein [Clostridia bacterium]